MVTFVGEGVFLGDQSCLKRKGQGRALVMGNKNVLVKLKLNFY